MNIKTQGIKYTGSKLKLLPFIFDMVKDYDIQTVFDGFSGTTRVSQMFAHYNYIVHCNDITDYSKVFGNGFLSQRNNKEVKKVIDHLNNVIPIDGWFTEHYGGDINDEKKLWQIHNTRKIDGIREEIDNLNLNYITKCVVLTSLILAIDKVDNTIGHFSSYLRKWSSRSYKDFVLKVPLYYGRNNDHIITQADANDVLKKNVFDLVYFDPPYGSNNDKMAPSRVRYASYYHIWKTICLNDKPSLFGKVNRRNDSRDTVTSSPYEDFRKNVNGDYIAYLAMRELLENTNSKYVLLSYSSQGRIALNDLLTLINNWGKVIEVKNIDYKTNVMSSMTSTNVYTNDDEKNTEYLILGIK